MWFIGRSISSIVSTNCEQIQQQDDECNDSVDKLWSSVVKNVTSSANVVVTLEFDANVSHVAWFMPTGNVDIAVVACFVSLTTNVIVDRYVARFMSTKSNVESSTVDIVTSGSRSVEFIIA